jgi:HPt (histidine-containing phosphotransfer) domain-containing protein
MTADVDPGGHPGQDWEEALAASRGTLMDPGAFVRLREWGGDVLLGKMVALFRENGPQRMEEIERGLEEGDASRVERGAHALKSSAGNLGAERLRRLCQLVEDAGEGRRVDDARALQPLLREAWAQTLRALDLSRTPTPADGASTDGTPEEVEGGGTPTGEAP